MEDLRYFTDTLNYSREEAFELIREGFIDAALHQYRATMDFIAKDASQLPEDQLQVVRNLAACDIRDIKESSEDVPEHLKARVCQSAAGYYIGTIHPQEGPYDRYSEYYGSHEEAQDKLERHAWAARW